MGKVLILINGTGFILNVLVFFIVVNYFEGIEGQNTATTSLAAANATKSDLERESAAAMKAIQNLGKTLTQILQKSGKVPDDLRRISKELRDLKVELRKLTAISEDNVVEEDVAEEPESSSRAPSAREAESRQEQ